MCLLEPDHLFEVAVEVNFSQDQDESWDHVARALLLSIKALVNPQTTPRSRPHRVRAAPVGLFQGRCDGDASTDPGPAEGSARPPLHVF